MGWVGLGEQRGRGGSHASWWRSRPEGGAGALQSDHRRLAADGEQESKPALVLHALDMSTVRGPGRPGARST